MKVVWFIWFMKRGMYVYTFYSVGGLASYKVMIHELMASLLFYLFACVGLSLEGSGESK